MLISCWVTVQLICAFVVAYAKSGFSDDKARRGLHSIAKKPNVPLIVSSQINTTLVSQGFETRGEKSCFLRVDIKYKGADQLYCN